MQEKRPRVKKRGQSPAMRMERVEPQTDNQELVFKSWDRGQNLLLSGSAGVGKTFLGLYLGLESVERGRCSRVCVVRSIVSSRDPGFLPGSLAEKTGVYEAPYYSVCRDLYGGDVSAYDKLKQKGVVEFMTTSFVRGVTLSDCVVVVDEIQNMRFAEIDTIITRVGHNCRIIFLGDYRQSDLTSDRERRGIVDFTRVVSAMPSFSTIEFTHADILRSDLVREYLIARDREGIIP